MPKVLISDTMSSRAEEVFRERGVEVDVVTELDPVELEKIIVNYDGLAVRSSTKVNAKIAEAKSTKPELKTQTKKTTEKTEIQKDKVKVTKEKKDEKTENEK